MAYHIICLPIICHTWWLTTPLSRMSALYTRFYSTSLTALCYAQLYQYKACMADMFFCRPSSVRSTVAQKTSNNHSIQLQSIGGIATFTARVYFFCSPGWAIKTDHFLPRCINHPRSSCEKGVRLSVCPSVRSSVCQTHGLWQNRKKAVQIFYTIHKII